MIKKHTKKTTRGPDQGGKVCNFASFFAVLIFCRFFCSFFFLSAILFGTSNFVHFFCSTGIFGERSVFFFEVCHKRICVLWSLREYFIILDYLFIDWLPCLQFFFLSTEFSFFAMEFSPAYVCILHLCLCYGGGLDADGGSASPPLHPAPSCPSFCSFARLKTGLLKQFDTLSWMGLGCGIGTPSTCTHSPLKPQSNWFSLSSFSLKQHYLRSACSEWFPQRAGTLHWRRWTSTSARSSQWARRMALLPFITLRTVLRTWTCLTTIETKLNQVGKINNKTHQVGKINL